MNIFFVSGFLGSGKTTSIINACRILKESGLKIGIITNDQGKHLVDNLYYNESGFPSREIPGGCFCCNYNDLDSHLAEITESEKPDIIFAESVGSCTDIMATVIKPLSSFRNNYSGRSSLTTFADARLLKARLSGARLPFSSDITYIFDRQIEEAGLLLINKSDILGRDEGRRLIEKAQNAYPEKTILLQSSFRGADIETWLEVADRQASETHKLPSMRMDYEKYASAEQRMAWLDKVFSLSSPSEDLSGAVVKILRTLGRRLARNRLSIGHLKLYVKPDNRPGHKISITGMDRSASPELPLKLGKRVRIILNARVEAEPRILLRFVDDVIIKTCRKEGISLVQIEENCFSPGKPEPTCRIE